MTVERSDQDASSAPDIATVGAEIGEIVVQIGPQFLELFSEHLYSSPNKAFEELVSNSWDAGARTVHVGMSDDLSAPASSVWVLDDGVSMDEAGLQALWAVASSKKREGSGQSARPQIGKFGIGKLATYILAHRLTYVCRASDGVTRAVTMDYRRIQERPGVLHINPLPLELRVLDAPALDALLATFPSGAEIKLLIDGGVPALPGESAYENEYGGTEVATQDVQGTWTLAVLTDLKPPGQAMQAGHIKRMLRYALPLGATLKLGFNGQPLESVKVGASVHEEWVLGSNTNIDSVLLSKAADANEEEVRVAVTNIEPSDGQPGVTIDGIDGPITGTVRLYDDRISGGKSEALGSSNGFFVNVRGRLVNTDDPYFGLENLNHSAWAKFRATVRADGLDRFVSVNREGMLEDPALVTFRKFLFALFNKARSAHDASARASWPNVGQVLTETWGTVPLQALRRIVTGALSGERPAPAFVNGAGVDREAALQKLAAADPSDASTFISDVVIEDGAAEDPFVSYELRTQRIVINRQHPFSLEHGETHEQQLLLRDAALADLLTQAFMADLGIDFEILDQVADYRDQALRLIAQRRRRTGVQLASLLADATQFDKGLEHVVGDALDYLGFRVLRLGQPGKTEGVATAPATGTDPLVAVSYAFTYDAKSTERGKVKTGNVGVAGLVRHRDDEGADHTLVVAPEYETGALDQECKTHRITPMRARDLARLLVLVSTRGPFDLGTFRALFDNYTPADVEQWVANFIKESSTRNPLAYDALLAALERLGPSGPDTVTVSVLAREIRIMNGNPNSPSQGDVRAVIRGLEVLVPTLVRLSQDSIYLGTTPAKLREAIRNQIRSVPEEFRVAAVDGTDASDGGAPS